MNELPDELQRPLAELDARAARAAARVDVERVAGRVLERLRTEPAAVPVPVRWRTALRIAAAVAVLATGTVLVREMTEATPAASVVALPVDLPDSLSDVQAAALMDAFPTGTDSVGVASAALTMDDLNEAELQALLLAMQSDAEGAL